MRNVLLAKHESDAKTSTSIIVDDVLKPRVELRSSLRRLGCHIRIPAFNAGYGLGAVPGSYSVTVEVVNYTDMDITVRKGARIAQMMFFFDSPSKQELDNEHLFLSGNVSKDEYRRHLELDHGWEVASTRELRSLVRSGDLGIEPAPSLRKGYVEVHAGTHARVLRNGIRIKFPTKDDVSQAFEEVLLPYKMKAGEYAIIDTIESFDLSERVGMLFFSGIFSHFPQSKTEAEKTAADRSLLGIQDGWVDPGYHGGFSRQPKTFYDGGWTIRPGDVLGYGEAIFFPNGVEKKYGSGGLGSHFQDQAKTLLVQAKR